MLTVTLTGTTTNIYFDWDSTPIATKTDHSSVNYSTNPTIYLWLRHWEYNGNRLQFTWQLDEFGIWGRVLTTVEIAELYNGWAWLTYTE
jgi:hypothetical protein